MCTRLAGTSVTREHVLEIRESSCVPRVAKHFFIPVVHSPLGVVGYVATPKVSPQGGRVRRHGTRGSAEVHFGREVRSRAEEHMAALELTSARRRGLGPRNTWQRWSQPRQEGEVWGHGTHSSVRAHLGREVRFRAIGYMAVHGCTPCSLF
jgi:hypothetical protein